MYAIWKTTILSRDLPLFCSNFCLFIAAGQSVTDTANHHLLIKETCKDDSEKHERKRKKESERASEGTRNSICIHLDKLKLSVKTAFNEKKDTKIERMCSL